MVKFCPVLRKGAPEVPLLFMLEVTLLKAVGRIEKRSVEQPAFPPCVTRTRTSRHALTGAVMLIVALLPFVHTGESDWVEMTAGPPGGNQVERQSVAAVIAAVLFRASSRSTVMGLVLYATLTPVR